MQKSLKKLFSPKTEQSTNHYDESLMPTSRTASERVEETPQLNNGSASKLVRRLFGASSRSTSPNTNRNSRSKKANLKETQQSLLSDYQTEDDSLSNGFRK